MQLFGNFLWLHELKLLMTEVRNISSGSRIDPAGKFDFRLPEGHQRMLILAR